MGRNDTFKSFSDLCNEGLLCQPANTQGQTPLAYSLLQYSYKGQFVLLKVQSTLLLYFWMRKKHSSQQ